MSLTTRLLAGTASAGLALSLAACGSGSSTTTNTTAPGATTAAAPTTTAVAKPATAAELISKVETATQAAKSVHFIASGSSDGKKMSIDFAGSLDGSNGKYAMTNGDENFEIISAGGQMYIKGNAAMLKNRVPANVADQLSTKYIKLPEAMRASFQSITTESMLKTMLNDFKKNDGTVGEETVDGKKTFVITSEKGKAEGQGFIAADGSWLPVSLTDKDIDSAKFTDWDKVPAVSAPPADQILDIPGLATGGATTS